MNARRGVHKRYFYPWNPLQLSAEVDSGLRVRKSSVTFEIFRTFKRKLLWTALAHDSMLVFYGNDQKEESNIPSHVETIVQTMMTQSQKTMNKSFHLSMYDFDDAFSELDKLDNGKYDFQRIPYESSFEKLIDELIDHRRIIKEKSKENGYIEAPNKQLQMIAFDLDNKRLNLLKNNIFIQEKFFSLLKDSSTERIYFLVLVENVDEFPKDFMNSFSKVYFLGDHNSHIAREKLFRKLPVTANSFSQELIGYGFESLPPKELVSLHSLKFARSEWKKAKEAEYVSEEELYRKFLLTLEDGSNE